MINNIDVDCLNKRINESELFTRRFGSFSKSDYEVLMFTIFIDSVGNQTRDYDISIALGIPESKVRNLRVKSQLMYPRTINWVDELNTAINHGYYDDISKQITITIEDPSVQNLIKNKIEENYGVVGLTLNSKQLILPVESFLLLAALSEKDPQKAIKELNKLLARETKNRDKIEKKSFKDGFVKHIPDMVAFISATATIYDIGRPIIESIVNLIS